MEHNAGEGVSTIGFRTTTTTTTTRSGSGTSFINYHHFKTVPGILKLVEILFGIICIATATPPPLTGTYFFLIVCYAAAIGTFAWILIVFFRIESKVPVNPSWPAMELIFTAITFGLYAMATAVQFSIFTHTHFIGPGSDPKPRSITAAVFGLFNCIAYAVGGFFAFRSWRTVTSSVQRNGQTVVY